MSQVFYHGWCQCFVEILSITLPLLSTPVFICLLPDTSPLRRHPIPHPMCPCAFPCLRQFVPCVQWKWGSFYQITRHSLTCHTDSEVDNFPCCESARRPSISSPLVVEWSFARVMRALRDWSKNVRGNFVIELTKMECMHWPIPFVLAISSLA